MHQKTNRGYQAGFSLIELMIVIVIIVIVIAISIPNVMRGMREYRLNNAAIEVANLIQQTRFNAVQLNRTINARATLGVVPEQAWIDLDNDGAISVGEPVVALPQDITFNPTAPPPPIGSMGPNYAAAVPPAGAIAFNSRGVVDFGGGATNVFVVFVGYDNEPTYGYRAITLTPMGKTLVWKAPQNGPWHHD